jgi:3-carboxy-cis,cis-muconate cycloisomerase
MTNLLWPGQDRAGDVMTDESLLRAMVDVESAWLHALVQLNIAPAQAAFDLTGLLTAEDLPTLATSAESTGNPVVPTIAELRLRAPSSTARWIHRGLTSQDTLDTALMLTLRTVCQQLSDQLGQQISVLATLADTHRHTPMIARTLTQHAIPTTFGAKAATWLSAIVDAHQHLVALCFPAQIGGAAGTLAASTELARLGRYPADAAAASLHLARLTAEKLGLTPTIPWHTNRSPVTTIGDRLVHCNDAWGRIASDLLTLSRPEIGEVTEDTDNGRGGSSTMPHKHNPVLSVLIKRAAIAAPPLAATLHTAAALTNDERPDGAWHTEWDTLRILARRTVVAGSQCSDLLAGLDVHPDRMAQHLGDPPNPEQQAMADLVKATPSPDYTGASDMLIDAALERARNATRTTA